MLYVMNNIESIDIDWEEDFTLAQILLSDYSKQFMARKKSKQKKAILITGVHGGIGTELAKQFMSEEFIVIGTDIHQVNDNDHFRHYYDYYFQANLSLPDDVNYLCDRVKK